MEKRTHGAVWWSAATLAGVLLTVPGLLLAWSINKPWLPGYLDL